MTLWSVSCPSLSATVRRSTPAITSLPANVWRLQCQLYCLNLASSTAVENQPCDPCEVSLLRSEGKTIRSRIPGFNPRWPEAPRTTAPTGIAGESRSLVLGR